MWGCFHKNLGRLWKEWRTLLDDEDIPISGISSSADWSMYIPCVTLEIVDKSLWTLFTSLIMLYCVIYHLYLLMFWCILGVLICFIHHLLTIIHSICLVLQVPTCVIHSIAFPSFFYRSFDICLFLFLKLDLSNANILPCVGYYCTKERNTFAEVWAKGKTQILSI